MTRALQWIGESKLFATFEQIFEHDVQGDKNSKKLPLQCFYKREKNSKETAKILIGGGRALN
jgi:hypothetical protein